MNYKEFMALNEQNKASNIIDIKKIIDKLDDAKKSEGTDNEIEQKKEAIELVKNNLKVVQDKTDSEEFKKIKEIVKECIIKESLDDKTDTEIDEIFSKLYDTFKNITKKNTDDSGNDTEQLNTFFKLAQNISVEEFKKVGNEIKQIEEHLSKQNGENQLGYLIANNPKNINKYSLVFALSNLIGNHIFKKNSAIFSGSTSRAAQFGEKDMLEWFEPVYKDGNTKTPISYTLKNELKASAQFIENALNSLAGSSADTKALLEKYNAQKDIRKALLDLGKEYINLNHNKIDNDKIKAFEEVYGTIKNDPAGFDEKKEEEKEKQNIVNTGSTKKYSNAYFGYTTQIPDSFPREADKSSVITNYYKELKAEALKHLEKISLNAQKQIKDVSKTKHSDLYWESNEVVNKVITEWIFKGAKDFDNPTQGNQRVKNLTGSHSKTEPGQEEQKNLGKYDVKIDELIKKDEKEAQNFYLSAMGRISTHTRRLMNLQIYNVLKGTKEKLHKLEEKLKKEIKGGTIRQLQVKAADKSKNGSNAKDANIREFENAEKEGQISDLTSTVRAFLLAPYKDQTTEIAKWVLAKIILLADNPRDAKEVLNSKFNAIGNKLGGSFHNGRVYDIKTANVLDKDAVAHFKGTVSASYESAKELIKDKGLGYDISALNDINVLKRLRKELTSINMNKELKELVENMNLFFAKRAEIQDSLKSLNTTSPAVSSINTEEYVKRLSESIFNKNGKINMIWESDDDNIVNKMGNYVQQAQTLETFLNNTKNGVYTSDTFTNMFGVEGQNSNKIEVKGGKGPEDIAFLQQLADVKCCIVNYNNKYYFMSDIAFGNYKQLKTQQNKQENEAANNQQENEVTNNQQDNNQQENEVGQTAQEPNKGQGLLKRAPQVLAAHEYGESAHSGTRGANDPSMDESGFSVKTEPQATVTTGAVGDVTIPQRMPNAQDIMKRKLNYTTYTYKNGPITIQKRKYDD